MSSQIAIDDRVGTLMGSYRLEERIGEGGMGAVYRAKHVRLPRRVAIKLLRPELQNIPDVFGRFLREAEIASSLGHRNIVEVFDFDCTADGTAFIVLELLAGESLAARLARDGRLSLAATVAIAGQIASAMTAAHARGIVHRDLKPQNVFLCQRDGRDDLVKVLDFGVSKILSAPTMTQAGALFGTPRYMSPEQAQGRQSEIDHRTDVFAFGAILYECLTGAAAFDAPSLASLVHQICYGAHRDVGELLPTLPEPVARVLDRALAKLPEDRPASAAALYDELVRAATGEPVARAADARTLSMATGEIAVSRRSRRGAGVLLGGAGFVVGVALAAWLVVRGGAPPAGAGPARVAGGAPPAPTPTPPAATVPAVSSPLPVEASRALAGWLEAHVTPAIAAPPALTAGTDTRSVAAPSAAPAARRRRPARATQPTRLPGLMEDEL